MNSKNSTLQTYGLWLFDMLALWASYAVSAYIRYQGAVPVYQGPQSQILLVAFMAAIAYHFFLDWNHDFLRRGYLVELSAVVKYSIFVTLVSIVTIFLFKWHFISRLVIGRMFLLNLLLTWAGHALFKLWMRHVVSRDKNIRKLLLISQREFEEETVRRIRARFGPAVELVGIVFPGDFPVRPLARRTDGIPLFEGSEGLAEFMTTTPVDELLIYTPDISQRKMKDVLFGFEEMGITCHYSLELPDVGARSIYVGNFGDYSVITYKKTLISSKKLLVKRAIDIAGGAVGLILTGLITLILAPAIKLDSPGPVFFSQVRVGKNGRRFKIYKFRSMFRDAEEKKKELADQNEVDGLMFKMENDPRVTRVGAFIRRTSLDEFPQFLNVLTGDMSLVGTRPPTESEFEQYNEHYRRRLSMTPGLTGMWQVSGRSDISNFDDVVRLDLEYIDNWSLKLDFKIILQTVLIIFTGRGAR